MDGGDLPSEYLEGIYKRIQDNPFTLKEDNDARTAQTGVTNFLAQSKKGKTFRSLIEQYCLHTNFINI